MSHEFTPDELERIKRAEEAHDEEMRRLGFGHLGALITKQEKPETDDPQEGQDTAS